MNLASAVAEYESSPKIVEGWARVSAEAFQTLSSDGWEAKSHHSGMRFVRRTLEEQDAADEKWLAEWCREKGKDFKSHNEARLAANRSQRMLVTSRLAQHMSGASK